MDAFVAPNNSHVADMDLVVGHQVEHHILELEASADRHHFYLTQELPLVHHC
jgi:hypothetical protein